MQTPFLVLIILALVIIASIITSIITYVILSGRNKRIRLAEQYRQLGITEHYLNIQEAVEKAVKSENIKLTTASPVASPESGDSCAEGIWFLVRGKDKTTSEKIMEYWHFICEQSTWKCIKRQTKV